ncbi:Os09g0464800 [Oryza sativa Japonica Group]|nr:Os09g0464800 [Oryza sativa Japonica Group]
MGDALVSEMCLHRAKIDAVVRMECERMHDGLEQARRGSARCWCAWRWRWLQWLREKEAELDAAHRHVVELEELLRHAATESQACAGSPAATRPLRLASASPSTTSSSATPPPNASATPTPSLSWRTTPPPCQRHPSSRASRAVRTTPPCCSSLAENIAQGKKTGERRKKMGEKKRYGWKT